MTPDLHQLSATKLARGLQSRSLSAEAVARACLARVAERDGELKAWVHVDENLVLAQARALDQGPVRGLLHGLPVGVKDVFDTHDMPTQYGSPIYTGNRPNADAAPVALAREAGAVLLGKTATTEFSTFQASPTRNPRKLQHTPGGSSSGSCAAVGDDMVPLAFGAQTAASIIRPAAYCGVVGYKPTHGLISGVGVKPLSHTLDTIGCIARTVDDVALFAAALSGDKTLTDLPAIHKPLRIGLCKPHADQLLPETHAVMELAAKKLAAAGAKVVEISLSPDHAELTQAHIDIMAFETARALSDERLRHWDEISAGLRGVIDKGLQMDYAHYAAQLRYAEETRATLPALYGRCDVLLAPSAAGEAPLFEAGTGDPTWCRMWTLLGLPCVHLPFTQGPQGLPVGLQAIGPLHRDRALLTASRWMLQQLTT
ncbi:amidase [Hylemonella gracilis str. Niagara R]|uniref:Amidase n=1 Tax=Hylemonella gracilis str. Niagara R TaxID=1458275 RepID=A0A016XCN2_9BURK|nr:amidase [Hylemonella gracilis]EYC49655.1 amidase [Hylemonella gracilis str. Niagara R]